MVNLFEYTRASLEQPKQYKFINIQRASFKMLVKLMDAHNYLVGCLAVKASLGSVRDLVSNIHLERDR